MNDTYKTTVSKRRQTTVPAGLPVDAGQRLIWKLRDGFQDIPTFEVTPLPKDPIKAFSGCFAGMGFGGVESLLRERRRDKKMEDKKWKQLFKMKK